MVKFNTKIAVIGSVDLTLMRKVEHTILKTEGISVVSGVDKYYEWKRLNKVLPDKGILFEDLFYAIIQLVESVDALVLVIPKSTHHTYEVVKEFVTFLIGYAWSHGVLCIYYFDSAEDNTTFCDAVAWSAHASIYGYDALQRYDFKEMPLKYPRNNLKRLKELLEASKHSKGVS